MTKEAQDVGTTAGKPFYRGTDKEIRVTLTTNGDISAWQIEANIRREAVSDDPPLITKRTANMAGGSTSQIIIDTAGSGATPGVFRILVNDTDTEGLAPRDYIWDVKRMDAGNEDVLAIGKLRVKAGAST